MGGPAYYATDVVSFTPGPCAGFGADRSPNPALGAPQGGGELMGGLDVMHAMRLLIPPAWQSVDTIDPDLKNNESLGVTRIIVDRQVNVGGGISCGVAGPARRGGGAPLALLLLLAALRRRRRAA